MFVSGRRLLFIPGPVGVEEDVLLESAKPPINHRGREFHALLDETLGLLKRVLRTRNEVVLLTSSGTGAVEALAANFGPRRRVLVVNAGEFGGRLAEALRVHGAQVVEVASELGTLPSLEGVLEKIEAVKPEVVAFVYNDTSPGIRVSYARELCRAAKEVGALVLVDAVSAAGGDELDVDSWGVDGLATASQKCLAAPPGLSFVVLSEEALGRLVERPTTVYFDLRRYLDYLKRRETPFTPAVTLVYALRRALQRILEVGVDSWIRLHVERAAVLYSAFESLGLVPFVRREEHRSRTVLSFTLPGQRDLGEIRRSLSENYGIEAAGGLGALGDRIIRFGVMGPVKYSELVALVTAVGLELRRRGVEADVEAALSKLEKLKGLYEALRIR